MKKYVILEKAVGETPLSCAETWRTQNPEYIGVPLSYAGRLDPMASGKLLVLIGEECKNQTNYHKLDKEYEFSVLIGIGSDTHDVLGRLEVDQKWQLQNQNSSIDIEVMKKINAHIPDLIGTIELPYPHFSAKTIKGKPLHMWTLENRLQEIDIPTKKSEVFSLITTKTEIIKREDLVHQALKNVNSIPPVTELRKALGNDFRRVDVRKDWENILNDTDLPNEYLIIHFRCVASSGTYMRSLAKIIGQILNTNSLAWHIHRTKIGIFDSSSKMWLESFK